MLQIVTHSQEETVALGMKLGRLLEPGDFIALTGDLGAGKTQLAKGVALGLQVAHDTPVTSPTYTILNIYEGRLSLYHFDLYRISGAEEASALGFDDYFFGDGVSLVEWAERLGEEIPDQALVISCSHLDEEERELSFCAKEGRGSRLLSALQAQL